MSEYLVLVLLHVFFGALWTGGAVLLGFWIIPSVVEAGPVGGAVMGGIMRRKMPQWMTLFGIITVLAGIRLFMIRAGAGASWFGTPEGLVLSVGALLALGGFGIAMGLQRPTAMKLGALGAQIAQGGGKPSPEQGAQVLALQLKLQKAARLQAFHLVAALLLMAAHRLAAGMGQ